MSKSVVSNLNDLGPSPAVDVQQSIQSVEALFPDDCFAEQYENLIAPLFKLPPKLPPTAWAGHIPFLFVLFRLIRPQTYVELGVYTGASLIAACAAAKSFCAAGTIFGIDTWTGDQHNGVYEGTSIYQDLSRYLDSNFPEAKLIRSTFLDARSRFQAGSIDVLNIDGFHTYEAVKEDFVTWFPAVAPQGVILFHDIAVFDRNFGVHRLWNELKKQFVTIEFPHSHGLGVLFMDAFDAKLTPLLDVAKRPQAFHFYQNLAADIANSLPERVGYYSYETERQSEKPPSQAEQPQIRSNKEALLLDRLLHSKFLRLVGPASKTWRRAMKERSKNK